MIAYVKGIITVIQEQSIIVDVTGIGYEIICPNPFDFQANLQKEVLVHTYHHVREDAISLYGFKDEDEKQLFIKLISVSGIGPKSAIAILSTAHVPEFVAAVEREDDKYLTQFPGVGKKTARQIILDLKGKLTNMISIQDVAETEIDIPNKEQLQEAKEALQALGYTEREITQIMPQLQNVADRRTDEIIRQALALLVKN